MAAKPTRGGTLTAITGGQRTLGAAVDAFLAQLRLATTMNRTYTRTLEKLVAGLGRDRPLADITAEELDEAAGRLWGGFEPRTWNRHLATVSSFLPGAADTAGPPGTWPCAPTAAPWPRTTPGRSRGPNLSACGHGRTSAAGPGAAAAAV